MHKVLKFISAFEFPSVKLGRLTIHGLLEFLSFHFDFILRLRRWKKH